jgi:hypothetical protein
MLVDDLSNIVFDAANNARSALDQVAYTTAQLRGVSQPKSAKFPFGPTKEYMCNNARGGCKDVPPEIVTLFKSFKPYKEGNNALWGLNELANTPKHKLLVPVSIGNASFFKTLTLRNVFPPTPIKPVLNREKKELIIIKVHPATDVEYNLNFRLTIALDQVDDVLRSQHPVALLRTMAGEVQRVLMATKAECRRIGLPIT